MVEQGGEPFLLPFPCCLPHTVRFLGHAPPALCRVHVLLNDVLPRLCPCLPTSAEGCPLLFGCFTDSTARPTSPTRSMPPFGLWPSRTGLVRQTKACWRSPGSRACCFSACAGFLDYAGPTIHSRLAWLSCCLPLLRRESASCSTRFRSSMAPPTDTSVYASSGISRSRLQDSRPGWIRCFLSCRALSSPTTCRFIPDHGQTRNGPVAPAPQL
jgi:hypothetical protein